MPTDDYVHLVQTEIRARSKSLKSTELHSLYFGGGTPSLLRPDQIISLIHTLENEGLIRGPACEVTMEINPATLSIENLETLIAGGVNRFSVGAQTFNDPLLKSVNREHSARQTHDTLELLRSKKINFSADILFALPGQDLEILDKDLDQVLSYAPSHISPYCLTVPEGHVLSKTRPLEEVQLEMFELIHRRLSERGYDRYEISNYCRPGFHSRHNSLYWDDEEYLGFGLSAHSYLKQGPWGTRFWNPPSIGIYADLVNQRMQTPWSNPSSGLPENLQEKLQAHEALTDFCHTSLRRKEGLKVKALQRRFGSTGEKLVMGPLKRLADEGLLRSSADTYQLSDEGLLVSNTVFRELTFLSEEWAHSESLSFTT